MLYRWVGRPLLELAYVTLGLFFGIFTFTVTVTGLALSIGLLPAFLLGVPVLVATVYLVHGMAVMERRRAMLFMDVDLPARPMPAKPGRSWLRNFLALTVSPEFWKEACYSLLLLPFGVVSGSLVLSFWAVAVAGLLLPAYVGQLPGHQAISWLHWDYDLEVTAGFATGLVFVLLSRVLTTGLAAAHVALASALLTPSQNDALRAGVAAHGDARSRGRRRRRRTPPDRTRPARRSPAAACLAGHEPRPREGQARHRSRRRQGIGGSGAPGGQGLHHRAAQRRPRSAPRRAHRPRARCGVVRTRRPLPRACAARRRRA